MTFSEFCGNSSFWDDDIFSQDVPKFSDCFITTVPAFISTGWLLVTFIYYVITTRKLESAQLPLRTLNVFKTGICIVLALLGLFDFYANDRYGYRCHSHKTIPASYILSSTLNIISFIYVAIATQINRRKGIVSSWLLWFYWIFVLIGGIFPLQDNILNQPSCLVSILQHITFGLSCVQVILYCLAEPTSLYGYERIGKPCCPKVHASVISKLFYWWFTPVVKLCYKRTIYKDELWDQLPDLQAQKVGNALHKLWLAEEKKAYSSRYASPYIGEYSKNGHLPGEETSLLQRSSSRYDDFEHKKQEKKPSLYRCCFRMYTLEWFRAAGVKLLCDSCVLIQPLILREIVKETGKDTADRVAWYGIALAVLMFIAGQLNAMFYIHASQLMITLGLKVKTALIGVIYHKTLTVSSSVKKDYTVGEVVNFVSVDCQRIQDAFTFSHETISFFYILIVGVYELFDVMGPSTLGCVAVIIIIVFINVFLGKLQEGYLMDILFYKGKRCKLLNEIIFGMKVIKMYAWEPYFAKKIQNIRAKEMAILRKIARVTACSIMFAVHSPFMMNLAILLIYTLASTSELFDAEKAFLALSVVNILRFPLTMIPYVITGLIQAFVSIRRIQQFLLTEDVNPRNVQHVKASDYAVSIQRGSFTWEKGTARPTLNGINVKIPEGKLIAVVGQVGSGKTSFISSILGELEKLEGVVKIKGSVAYISQEAWIQNMTVRDNILYGHSFNERKYEKVLEGCCLQTDLKILSAGDMTEIGERGINLSGGQKQRVNLARAVYSNCDIYLFDDPLSAVDSHVGKDLFKKVIGPEGMLRHKLNQNSSNTWCSLVTKR